LVPTIVPTSTSGWSLFAHAAGGRGPDERTNGILVRDAGAPGAVTVRAET
jgi:hypothetical protein